MSGNIVKSVLIATSFAATLPTLQAGDQVDALLVRHAPKISHALRNSDVNSVAVLPFRLKSKDSGFSLDSAQIQELFARKLERALALYNNPSDPIKVVFDAWQQVLAHDSAINFGTKQGRRQLFALPLKLPVDEPALRVDALLSGTIEPSDDYRSTTVHFALCRSSDPGVWKELEQLAVTFPTDATTLVRMGRGFSLSRSLLKARSIGDDAFFNSVAAEEVYASNKDDQQGVSDPLERVGKEHEESDSAGEAVTIEVFYDGIPQQFFRDEEGGPSNRTMKDPAAGQVVTFQLENTTSQVLSVLLAVNGKNTLYGGDVSNLETAAKWVLQPGRVYRVRGVYARDLKSFQPLIGLSDKGSETLLKKFESEAGYVDPNIGTIQMVVFQQTADVGSSELAFREDGKRLPSEEDTKQGNKNTGNTEHGNGQPTGLGTPTDPVKPPGSVDSIDADDADNTGFSLELVRGINITRGKGSFHPTRQSSVGKNWSELRRKIARDVGGAGDVRGAGKLKARGIIQPSGKAESVELETTNFKGNREIQHVRIRYFSRANPELAQRMTQK